MKSYPKISIVIPTINEEDNIKRCLSSVLNQDYPSDKIEILVVDDSSTDRTVDIAQKLGAKVIRHNSKHGEIGKKIGFDNSKGELFYYLDADAEFGNKRFLKLMAKPLIEDKRFVASITDESSATNATPIERYLSLDPLQRDPLFSFLSPGFKDVIQTRKDNYTILEYTHGKIPPAGRCLYRKKVLEKYIKDKKEFLELDILVTLVENGYQLFAYVPQAKLYHHHVTSLRQLIRKRTYNLRKVYMKFYDVKKYVWVDFTDWRDIAKILIWTVFSLSIVGPLVSGIIKSIRFRTIVGLYDMIVIPSLTILYISEMLKSKNLLTVFKR